MEKLRITSEGEQINGVEFLRRRSDLKYCDACGALLRTCQELRTRCGQCSTQYWDDYVKSVRELGADSIGGTFDG